MNWQTKCTVGTCFEKMCESIPITNKLVDALSCQAEK